MTAVSVEIAEGVLRLLRQTEFIIDFEAERSYADWTLELEDAGKLRVDVVPVTTDQAMDLSSRTTRQYTIPVDIAVRQRFGMDFEHAQSGRIPNEHIDKRVALVQEIHEAFSPVALPGTEAIWQAPTTTVVCPLIEHLREYRQFTGIVRVIFRMDTKI